MNVETIIAPDLAVPNGHFAHASAIKIGEATKLVFVSGMTARDSQGGITGVGDVTAQTHQVCQNIRSAVEAVGGTLADVVRLDVYVRNMEDFDAIHAVRRQYFTDHPPSSTMIEVADFVKKDYLVEISAIASVGDEV